MQPIASHSLLVTAKNFENACAQVEEFFANTPLVRYDKIVIDKEKSYSAHTPDFDRILHKEIVANRNTLQKLVAEFKKTGFETIADLPKVECGYPSKLLHTITHFLDGFIGIDSTFYNLHEDSHWVSDNLRKKMREHTASYWIIHLNGFSDTPEQVSLVES